MIKLTTTLSQKNYSYYLLMYLINRLPFKIISIIIWIIVSFSCIIWFFFPNSIPIHYLLIWFLLALAYYFLVPILIRKRLDLIYQNTPFLQNPIYFTIDKEHITWETSIGSKTYPLSQLYKVCTTQHSLIIAFSPYQIFPIAYEEMDTTTWDSFFQVISQKTKFKLNNKYYQSQTTEG